MRTITLELVRHGPAYNQLLSPLTQYLALCENHPAVTLQLPLEHGQMLYRLRALAYRMGKEPREFQVQDTGRLLSDLLARIPGLTADMNRQDTKAGEAAARQSHDNVTHLRLVLSASELALLPFELALAPMGFPGAGQPLALQSLQPISVTRETRRVAEEDGDGAWLRRTRVLVVVASPPGLVAPPAEAHLLALRKALEPWVGTRDESSTQEGSRLSRRLTVLTDASLEAIEAECARGDYTHVHILAHGGEYAEGYDTRFGLMLHSAGNPAGPVDYVSGERLATALRTTRHCAAGRFARPLVVTLASCHSGAVGSVTGVSASIAHALHADGIPVVIASQFPLSFGGSVRMVETLYEGLLSGADPRRVLVDLRRTLHTQFPDTHDWASIAAYCSLPPDFDRRLAQAQVSQAHSAVEAALNEADDVVAHIGRGDRRSANIPTTSSLTVSPTEPGKIHGEVTAAMERVRAARHRLECLLKSLFKERGRIVALLASSDKREAALEYEALRSHAKVVAEDGLATLVWPLLERARRFYDEAFGLDPGSHWAAVQYISLSVVLRGAGRLPPGDESPSRDLGKLWALSEVQSLRDLSGDNLERRAWALGNLIELYLLAPVIPAVAVSHPQMTLLNWGEQAVHYAKQLVDMADPGAFEVFSTRRQILRYLDLYVELCPSLELLVPAAKNIVLQLPPPSRDLER